MRHLDEGQATDLAGTRAMVRAYIERQVADGYSFWAVVERATGTLVGDVRLHPFDGPDAAVEVGYTLGRAWWGRGYATEAAAACVTFACEGAGARAVVALVDPVNHGSLRVLEKLGFDRAGTRLAYGHEHALLHRSRTRA